MTENFDSVRYRRRYLVETRFSVLKRKFGADLKSCIFQIQKKEISCKIILANLHRFLQFHFCEVFYRADNFILHIVGKEEKLKEGSVALCSDTVEALIGAIFIDSGDSMTETKKCIEWIFKTELNELKTKLLNFQ